VCLLVLGMHRSGTSALTRALHLAGAALPRTLLEARADNPDGYWESARLVALHEQILRSIGSHGLGAWSAPIAQKHAAARPASAAAMARGFALECDSPGTVAIKDPRLCHLADLAGEAIRSCGRTPFAVHVIRAPDDVARSLSSRNVIAPTYAALLWRQYTLHAEQLTRGWRRMFIRYERFLERPAETIESICAASGMRQPSREQLDAVRAWITARPRAAAPAVDDAAAHELDAQCGLDPLWPDAALLDRAWERAVADTAIVDPGCDPKFLIGQSEKTISWAQTAAVVTEWALREGADREEALDVDRLLRGLALRIGFESSTLTSGQAPRDRLATILQSTSWRMTEPLRRLVDRFRT